MAGKTRKIWDEGEPLKKAWRTFANPKVKADYEATFQQSGHTETTHKDPRIAVQIALKPIFELAERRAKREELLQVMQSDLIEWLFCEEFYAYGFPVFPSDDRTPRRIPCEFWDNPQIDWNGGIANDASLKFERIRIVDPRDLPEIDLKPKIGRESNKTLIYQAIKKISKLNSDFERNKNKDQIRLIREFIKSENPHLDVFGKGFGDDAIRKHVKSYFKEKNSN